MKKILSALSVLVFVISACTPTTSAPQGQSVDDIVASTFQAMTAAAPTATQPAPGIPVSLNGLSFVIPTGLATGAQFGAVAAVPPGEGVPWWGTNPAYNQYLLEGYSLPTSGNEATLYVFPVDEYSIINPEVGKLIQNLREILAAPSLPTSRSLPFLPTFNASQVFYSNLQKVQFQNGTGIRYLTQFSQFPGAIVNGAVIYTFQGLTSDGKYYVTALLPINAPVLQTGGDPSVPPNGVPFEEGNFDAHPAYVDAVTQKLNAMDPNLFNPSIPNLDALVHSILVGAETVSTPATSDPQAGMQTNSQFSFSSIGLDVKFNYPVGLKEGLASEVVAAGALDAPQTFDYPEHIVIYFAGYSSPVERDGWSPGIRIFRVTDLNNMNPDLVPLLKSQTASTSHAQRVTFPRLPYPGYSVDAQFKNIAFQNGTGFRFLVTGSFVAQAPSGTGLTYAYSGFTSDGKYLVSLTFHVDAPMIASLADGHPYDSQEESTNSINALNALVNSGSDSDFDPALSLLDSIVASIIIAVP